MNIRFESVCLSDRERIQSYTLRSPYNNCDFSFANLYGWSHLYKTCVAFHKDMLIVKFEVPATGRVAFLTPIGPGSLTEVLEDLEAYVDAKGVAPLTLVSITPKTMEVLRKTHPENLHVLSNEDNSDYIYLREDLVSLKGKRLQSKRNHINKFKRLYPNYRYEPINDSNVAGCIALEKKWYGASDRSEDITAERKMVLQALEKREQIGLTGGCIIVDDKVVAFTMGMPINTDTFGIQIEKADVSYEGSFAIINQMFAQQIPEEYTYVNREEDLGIPGLRKAKQSYRPHLLLQKDLVMLRYDNEETEDK